MVATCSVLQNIKSQLDTRILFPKVTKYEKSPYKTVLGAFID